VEAQPFLDKLLHLGLFIAALGFVGVGAVAVLERVVGSAAPVVRRVHLGVALAAVTLFAAAERLYHAVT
jgi:hypothetical protein